MGVSKKKKVYYLTVLLFLMVVLAACGSTQKQDEDVLFEDEMFNYQEVNNSNRVRTVIIEDKETWCKYLYHRRGTGGGLSLMYDENGEPNCGKEE